MIVCKPPPVRHGTCEICGGHDRDLRIMILPDFIGWGCGQCREQISKSEARRFIYTGEQTEPSE